VKRFVLLCSCAAIAVPFAVATLGTTAAEAQQITTSIQGRVTNESGAPVADAAVSVTDTRTGVTQTFTTDSTGSFAIPNLTTGGPYTVTAVAKGLQGQTVNDINTTLQGPTQLTFALSAAPAATAEAGTIIVTAARVRATQLAVGPGTSFGTQVMQNAPSFNRDVRDVIRMDPRVSLDREDAATNGSGQDRISCLGGNDRSNTFTIDGIPQSDIYGLNDTGFSSRSSTPIPYDAVRETQVQFAPFDVEYGGFQGCAINVVTKSGSNRFHGSAFYELSNNSLRGDKVGNRDVAPIGPDKRWGVSLGGPIIKDHLFFFGAYEHQKAGQSQDEGPTGAGFANEVPGVSLEQFNEISQVLHDVYGIDTGPLVHNRPYENERIFGRVDWQISDGQRLEVTYQRLNESTMKSDDLFTGSSPNLVGENTFFLSGTKSKYYSARLYSNWTDRFSTEFRYAHSDVKDVQDPVGGGEAQSGNPIPRIIVGIDNPPLGTSSSSQVPPDATVLGGPGISRSANDLSTKLDLFRGLAKLEWGDHRLKAGIDINRADIFNLFVSNATGTLVFRNVTDLRNGILSNPRAPGTTSTFPNNVVGGATVGAFGNFTASGDVNDAAAAFSRTIYSAYVQDDWAVNDDLKVVAGVRTDWFSGGRPTLNTKFVQRYGFRNDTGFDDIEPIILPRVGFTYHVQDFSVFRRSRLQGGVGIFSGGDPIVWFANAFQNDGNTFATGTSAASNCPAGPIDVVTNGTFTGFPQCVKDAAGALASTGNGFTQAVDPNIRMPTVWRANIGYQANMEFGSGAFGRGWQLNLDYIYSLYRNPFTVVDLTAVPDIRKGLNGFSIDGRPIYASIDPLLCGAQLVGLNPTPIYTGVTAACYTASLPASLNREAEYVLSNAGSYRTHVASIILSKNFDAGLFTSGGSSYFTLGYAYTNAHDRRNMFSSTASSNYGSTAAFDRQDPAASRGFYESRHNVSLSGNLREKFFGDNATSLGFTFVARSGRPYSLTFSGSNTFNDGSAGSNNSLLYIPSGVSDPNISPTSNMTAVQQLADWAKKHNCAKDYLGKSIDRNTCSNDWYYDLDLRLAQEFPGPGRLFGSPLGVKDKITVYAMFDNFLNFFNKDWNVQHRRNFVGLQDIAASSGVDAQGRYIITGAAGTVPSATTGLTPYQAAEFINVSGSVWRIKVGINYDF
jgi:Carboxypeptidase regulatory-like domain/TonB dependent receptor/TonB-dependent Receptor Plug Domain